MIAAGFLLSETFVSQAERGDGMTLSIRSRQAAVGALATACVIMFTPAAAAQTTTASTTTTCVPANTTRQLNQYIAIQDCWDQTGGNSGGRLVAEHYAKWRVRLLTTDPTEFYRDYRGEHRNTLVRLFAGKTRSTIVGLKLQVTDPALEFSIPLMAINYQGKVGTGQSYATTLTSSNADQPYFRLSTTTSTAISLSAKSTKDADSRLAARTLSAVQNALKIAAPQVTLLTELNKDNSSRLASALDTTLASLLSEATTETITATKSLESWTRDSKFLVRVDLPRDVPLRTAPPPRTPDAADTGKIDAGSVFFEVMLSCPRVSIFHSEDLCAHADREAGSPAHDPIEEIRQNVSAPQVLSFELSPGKTIREHITSQAFFLNFLRELPRAAATDTEAGLQLAAFCDAVVTELRAVGLSTLDARIGNWAVISGIGDLALIRNAAGTAGTSRTCNTARPSPTWIYNRDAE